MDDKIKGTGNVVKGKVEQGVGNVTGDAETEARGDLDEARGRGQQVVGDVRQGLNNTGDRTERAVDDLDNDLNRR